jgi:elongation factor P
MGVRATEIRKGQVIELNGDLYVVTDYEHKTPGNLRAIINIKAKSLKTGSATAMRLGSGDVLEVAYLDRKRAEYLYREASSGNFVFMDTENYEQFELSEEFVGDKMGYVKENTQVEVSFHGTTAVGVVLPPQVVLQVTHTENAVKGNTTGGVKKDATLETGLTIKVPIHVGIGDMVKVATETGEFQGRATDK